jgi:Rha family phage regulatory protein
MNALIAGNGGSLTMTSREIAELTGKEHRNVLSDIRAMLVELHGEGGLLSFQQSYINSQNKEMPEFKLPKREALILTSGYSLKQRAAIIDRWQELEARPEHPLIPQTLPEALRLAADLADQRNIAQAALAIAAPKAEALGRIADAEGRMNPTVPEVLRDWLGIFPARTRTGSAGSLESGTTNGKAEDFD